MPCVSCPRYRTHLQKKWSRRLLLSMTEPKTHPELDPDWEINPDQLIIGPRIGQGAFGDVFQAEAVDVMDGFASVQVAVKRLKENASTPERVINIMPTFMRSRFG